MMMLVPEAWEKLRLWMKIRKLLSIQFLYYGTLGRSRFHSIYRREIYWSTFGRNGLRPSRYTVTKDGYVIMSSETGVLEIDPKILKCMDALNLEKCFW